MQARSLLTLRRATFVAEYDVAFRTMLGCAHAAALLRSPAVRKRAHAAALRHMEYRQREAYTRAWGAGAK